MMQGGSIYYVHGDNLGTPQIATDASRTVIWNANGYEPFGTTGMFTDSITQDLRLPGQFFDAESAIYHNGARNYLPTLGRYAESDPIGLLGGSSTYAYADDNPYSNIDPSGLTWVYSQSTGRYPTELIPTQHLD
jgi:RHS repeat-associated protein